MGGTGRGRSLHPDGDCDWGPCGPATDQEMGATQVSGRNVGALL